jgi:hypothetical protein
MTTEEVETPAEKPTETAVVPKGKAAMMARYKKMNPDNADDPDDESLMDWAHKGLGERDEYEGKYNSLNGMNEKLASAVGESPRVAQFIAMIANGEDPMYAIGKVFGNLLDKLDDESLEKYKKGQDEFSARYKKVKDNFGAYESTLKKYGEENNLDQEMISRINSAILDMAEAFSDREIPKEVIEIVHKGLTADENDESKLAAAELGGRNKLIDEIKGNKTNQPALPDPNGVRTNKPVQKKVYTPKNENLADAITDKE